MLKLTAIKIISQRKQWAKVEQEIMYLLPATKLKGPAHIGQPQLVFCALLTCTLWASLEVLQRDPSQHHT